MSLLFFPTWVRDVSGSNLLILGDWHSLWTAQAALSYAAGVLLRLVYDFHSSYIEVTKLLVLRLVKHASPGCVVINWGLSNGHGLGVGTWLFLFETSFGWCWNCFCGILFCSQCSCLYVQLLYKHADNLSKERVPQIFRQKKSKKYFQIFSLICVFQFWIYEFNIFSFWKVASIFSKSELV